MLNDLLLQRRLSVVTVDSFQGQERDIIAITLTRSNPQGEIGFLSDIRRMNVGTTRARRKLLLKLCALWHLRLRPNLGLAGRRRLGRIQQTGRRCCGQVVGFAHHLVTRLGL